MSRQRGQTPSRPAAGPDAGAAAGRDADFVAFTVAVSPGLRRTAWLLTGSAAEADDLVQDALVRTYLAWHRIREDDARAYARRVLANLHVDRWRRSRRELAAWTRGGPPRTDAAELPQHTSDDRDEVVRALQRLRPRERTVLVLRYYLDLSEAQVARELGISTGTVKSTASRAIARLRRSLDDAPDATSSLSAIAGVAAQPGSSR